jgi:hypothetical protein
MALFRKTRFYLVSEPLRGALLASYLKANGRSISFPSPCFFLSKNGEKIPLFPLFLPSGKEKEISFSRLKLAEILEGSISKDYEGYINIAIGESIRVRGFENREILLEEFRREFGEKSFVHRCFSISEEMKSLYEQGKKDKAREKWENLKEFVKKLKEEERGIIKAIFCSWTFITHRLEQKKIENGAFPFLAGFQTLKRIQSPDKLWSRTTTLLNFYQLTKPSDSQILQPSQLPDEDKGLSIRKKIWMLTCENKNLPEEMKNPVIYLQNPMSEPIYIEKLPWSTSEKAHFLIFSSAESSEEDIKRAFKTLAPLLEEPAHLFPAGEENFSYLSDFIPRKVMPLIPSVPSHISVDIISMERDIK